MRRDDIDQSRHSSAASKNVAVVADVIAAIHEHTQRMHDMEAMAEFAPDTYLLKELETLGDLQHHLAEHARTLALYALDPHEGKPLSARRIATALSLSPSTITRWQQAHDDR